MGKRPYISSVNMWLAGLAVTGMQSLELLQEEWFTRAGLVPELSFFQCHACHHPMDDLRWSSEPDRLPPGAVRLNDASLVVLLAVLETLSPDDVSGLRGDLNTLHQASQQSRERVVSAARALHARLEPLVERLSKGNYGPEQQRQLRRELLAQSAAERFRHFTAAEQAFLAVETLSLSLGDAERLKSRLDAWYASVEDENRFVPQQFAVLARQLMGAL